jgi:hypothetical protein
MVGCIKAELLRRFAGFLALAAILLGPMRLLGGGRR